jgi:hypothetical protein
MKISRFGSNASAFRKRIIAIEMYQAERLFLLEEQTLNLYEKL